MGQVTGTSFKHYGKTFKNVNIYPSALHLHQEKPFSADKYRSEYNKPEPLGKERELEGLFTPEGVLTNEDKVIWDNIKTDSFLWDISRKEFFATAS